MEFERGHVEDAIVALEARRPHRCEIEIEPHIVPVHLGRDLVVAEPLVPAGQIDPAFRRQMIVRHGLVFGAQRLELGRFGLNCHFCRCSVERIEKAQVRHDPPRVGVLVAGLQIVEETERADVGFRQSQLVRLGLEGEVELDADGPALAECQPLDRDVLGAALRLGRELERIDPSTEPWLPKSQVGRVESMACECWA